jgi:hypothetical protein
MVTLGFEMGGKTIRSTIIKSIFAVFEINCFLQFDELVAPF